jgi:hypothetical protein
MGRKRLYNTEEEKKQAGEGVSLAAEKGAFEK